MNILALDLGTVTGWAAMVDGYIRGGVQEFRVGRHQGAGMQFVNFRGWLDRMHQDLKPERIVYEEVRRHLGVDAAHTYGGFWSHLTAWCQEHQVPFEGVPVATIKKHATGKGNTDKDAMIEAARRASYFPADHNEADALALLHYTLGLPFGPKRLG